MKKFKSLKTSFIFRKILSEKIQVPEDLVCYDNLAYQVIKLKKGAGDTELNKILFKDIIHM